MRSFMSSAPSPVNVAKTYTDAAAEARGAAWNANTATAIA